MHLRARISVTRALGTWKAMEPSSLDGDAGDTCWRLDYSFGRHRSP